MLVLSVIPTYMLILNFSTFEKILKSYETHNEIDGDVFYNRWRNVWANSLTT